MAVPTARNLIEHVEDGVVETFPFDFKIFAVDELEVVQTDLSGNRATLVLNVDYTVAGAGLEAGGSITKAAAPTGYGLSIKRVVDATQLARFRNQGSFLPETHENALDHLAMVDQQQQEELGRAAILPEGTTPSALPPPINGSVLGWSGGVWAWLSGASVSLASNLLDGTSAALGPALVAYNRLLGYAAGTVGYTLNTLFKITMPAEFYGAVGDGATDDTAALNAAKAAAKTLILSDGKTYLTSALTISVAGSRIVGSGCLKLKSAQNTSLLTVTADSVFIGDGVELDGNRANQTLNESSITSANGHGVYVAEGVSDLTVHKAYIHDMICNGITGAGNHYRNRYANNKIKNINLQGIFPTVTQAKPFYYGIITQNEITEIGLLPPLSGGGDGIGTVGMKYTILAENTIKNCKFACIALEAGNSYVSLMANILDGEATCLGLDANGDLIMSKPTVGLQINDCWNISAVGNTIRNCAAGVAVSGSSDTKNIAIHGNNVSRCGIGIDLGAANLFATPMISCTGNTISNTYGPPARILKIAYCTFGDNTIEGVNLQNATGVLHRAGIIVAQGAQFNNIHHNTIRKDSTGADAATGYMDVGLLEMSFAGGAPYQNNFDQNTIVGATYYPVIVNPVAIIAAYPMTKVTTPNSLANAPTTGSWRQGQTSWRANAASGSPAFDMCKTSGQFAAGQTGTATATAPATVINMSNVNGFFPGMAISIAGAGPAAAALATTISAVDRITNTITVVNPTSTTVAGAAVSMTNPVFTSSGNLA